MNWERYKIPVAVIVLALLPVFFFEEGVSYVSRIFTIFLLYATLALALDVAFGQTDQLLLFTGGIAGIGTYTAVEMASVLGVSLWGTILVGGLAAGIVGAVVCWVAARRQLNVIVISILTISLQLAMIQTFNALRDITGGNTGMEVPVLTAEAITSTMGWEPLTFLYYLFLVVLTALMVVHQYLTNSKFGLAFDMIRQDEMSAASTGVDVVRYKSFAGFVATFFMGVVGPLYVQIGGYVTPGMFNFAVVDVLVLIILVVGGMRTIYGPIVGAALIVYLNEALQQVQEFRRMLFGALLIVLFLYFRNGIVRYARNLAADRFDVGDRLPS